jgi:YgiT-type zinc finger domain-containing protein
MNEGTNDSRSCGIQGCPGMYEEREVVHTVRHRGEIVVIQGVPAEVCSVCGDVLLAPETVRHLQRIVRERAEPEVDRAPVYQYA